MAHRECLSAIDGYFSEKIYPSKNVFVVNIAADLPLYEHANMHIVQNIEQQRKYIGCYYVPHWPQPGMITRELSRKDKLENIAYFGNQKNITAQLYSPEWKAQLEGLGFNWQCEFQKFNHLDINTYTNEGCWSNYKEIDAIVAIRKFDYIPGKEFNHKPATKLYNAWLAGTPAILGRESAYLNEKINDLDFLEVHSEADTIKCLQLLRSDRNLRQAMIANGFERAKDIHADKTVEKWFCLLKETIIPKYRIWLKKHDMPQPCAYLYCEKEQSCQG